MIFSILLFASLAQAAENRRWGAETSKLVLLGDPIFDLEDVTTLQNRASVINHSIILKSPNGEADQETTLTVAELLIAARANERDSYINGRAHGEFYGIIYGATLVGSFWALKKCFWDK